VFFNILQAAIESYTTVRDALIVLDPNSEAVSRGVSFDTAIGIHTKKQPLAVTREYLSCLRQLILSLSSLSTSCTAVFPSDEERGAFVNFIMQSLVPLLSSSMNYLTTGASVAAFLPRGVTEDAVAELCVQESEHVLFILIRLLGESPPRYTLPA
jgi:hypothetical protein